jgi:hypothetical protein
VLLMYELKYDSFVFGSRKGIVYDIVFVCMLSIAGCEVRCQLQIDFDLHLQ